jgi:F420-dependent oxidoreductase-like protein
MEFGTLVPQGWRLDLTGIAGDRAKWDACRRVIQGLDAAGWSSLWVWDHFHTFPEKRVEATFESWMMMSAMTELTTRARIGQIVTCNEYRNPSYLAKISACVDVASGGRLNLGIGAGWFQEEFQAFGYDYRTIGARLARLGESLEILKRMWTEETTTFEGRHYRLVDAVCEPKPVQKPRPPIWIGGRGEKVLLKLVARHADVWNYNGSQKDFAHFRDVLKGHCRTVGRDFDEIKITAMSGGIAFENDAELDRFLTRIAAQNPNREFLLHMVDCHGSRARCAEFIDGWRRLGVHGLVFYFHDIATFGDGESQAEIFRRDILPR